MRVVTGSRLHAGFYSVGQRWGSLGFYIDEPRLELEARECGEIRIEGLPEHAEAVERTLRILDVDGVCIRASSYIPAHTGLGSTTQTLLAVAIASLSLKGVSVSPIEIAIKIGRAKVSGVGTLLFALGGFVADAGVPSQRGPIVMTRLEIPEEWSFVVAIPAARRGLREEEEEFMRSMGRADAQAELLMARGALKLMAGVAKQSLEEALEGLREVQLGTGKYFMRIQGGTYRADVQRLVDELHKDGMIVAQSSWGPAIYTITERSAAPGDAAMVKHLMGELGIPGNVFVAQPRNRGAEVK